MPHRKNLYYSEGRRKPASPWTFLIGIWVLVGTPLVAIILLLRDIGKDVPRKIVEHSCFILLLLPLLIILSYVSWLGRKTFIHN